MKISIKPRLPCPVCLGVRLDRVRLTDSYAELVLDACGRCGGIWFELGEVQRLRRIKPAKLWKQVPQRHGDLRAPCHNCHGLMDRNAEACKACGWRNVIDCPSCARPLRVDTHRRLRVDVCNHCEGVWLDHVELNEIWKRTLQVSAKRRKSQRKKPKTDGGTDVAFYALDALTYSPDLVLYGARTAGMGIEAAAEALKNLPDLAAAAWDGFGEVAAALFDAVVDFSDFDFDF